jgi:TPR repeat protein
MSILLKRAEMFVRRNQLMPAYELLLAAEAKGSSDASYAIGTWYLFGKHVKKDLYKAVQYFTKAGERGNSDALFNLAICYEKGAGVNKDLEKAFKYYLEAYNRGDVNSAYEIGRMLYYGLGITKNIALAQTFINLSEKKRLTIRKQDSKIFPKPSRSISPQLT